MKHKFSTFYILVLCYAVLLMMMLLMLLMTGTVFYTRNKAGHNFYQLHILVIFFINAIYEIQILRILFIITAIVMSVKLLFSAKKIS